MHEPVAIRLHCLGSQIVKNPSPLTFDAGAIPGAKHPRHRPDDGLPEISPPRAEVVVEDDCDGPVARNALNEFKRYPGCQGERDPTCGVSRFR